MAYIDNSLKSRLQLLLAGSRPRTERIENCLVHEMAESLKKNVIKTHSLITDIIQINTQTQAL